MATKRRKTTRRRSTRRRRLGALPVYPNAMGIMGTSAMLGPVTVGLGGTSEYHKAELNREQQGLRFLTSELGHEITSGRCADMTRTMIALAKAVGKVEAEGRYVPFHDASYIQSANGMLDKAFRALPNACRR